MRIIVQCKACSTVLSTIDKDNFTQEEFDMYSNNCVCSVCNGNTMNVGAIDPKVNPFEKNIQVETKSIVFEKGKNVVLDKDVYPIKDADPVKDEDVIVP